MTFHATSRWGNSIHEPNKKQLRDLLGELDKNDIEHVNVSVTHESEWCLGAFPSGLLVWENLENGEPKHMNLVSRDQVLSLWLMLAAGSVLEIEALPWLPGYEDPA